ncbi:hypothetical protein WME89_51020 [Sorangium sp. So ce321]|uniref:hypothetical protein n=1 Tax=Sorangium sp. So ce321 TaxID=3133300 RepID=UPI003F641F33
MKFSLQIAAPAIAAALALGAPRRALAEAPMRLPRLTGPVVLDGAVDEAAWRAVAPAPVIVYEPVFGGAPSQVTEIRVAHDDDHLYLAARLRDTEPAEVRASGTLSARGPTCGWSTTSASAARRRPTSARSCSSTRTRSRAEPEPRTRVDVTGVAPRDEN